MPASASCTRVAIALSVGPLRLWTARFALDQAGVFDPLIQAMLDDGVLPVDEGRQVVVFPDEKALISVFRFLQHKAQSSIVAFVLDAGEATTMTAKTHPESLSQADAVEGAIGTTRQGLREYRIEVLGQPAHSESFAGFVQGVLRKPILLAQRRKCSGSLLFLRVWNGTGDLPDWISPHGPQPLESFGEDRVVELPSGFEVGAQAGSLANTHLQRQLEQ